MKGLIFTAVALCGLVFVSAADATGCHVGSYGFNSGFNTGYGFNTGFNHKFSKVNRGRIVRVNGVLYQVAIVNGQAVLLPVNKGFNRGFSRFNSRYVSGLGY